MCVCVRAFFGKIFFEVEDFEVKTINCIGCWSYFAMRLFASNEDHFVYCRSFSSVFHQVVKYPP